MKVGWVTSDNASNNDTMMHELVLCLKATTLKPYDPFIHRIRYDQLLSTPL